LLHGSVDGLIGCCKAISIKE